ncbi:uncharacterized protein L3040_006195 [Drepanopeziza brunnea f. sp. 'multigermtubi']|uniref:uncharacterized protein n=1 Tax=Drepanopeziza brunnea f. sp. 'multigermtubi' TaxID=698441 RepID=UPI002397AA81|nr:hypothetical protein L3040_006195 [Drepanopeziza brunnea f. sp. 'multigermtubi']
MKAQAYPSPQNIDTLERLRSDSLSYREGKGAQLVKCPPSDLYKSTARLPVHLQFSMLLCETYRYSYDTSPKAAGRVPDSEVPDQRLWCVEPSRMGWSSDVQVSELGMRI